MRSQRANEVHRKRDEALLRHHLSALLILTILIFLAYSNSLHGTWALDDTLVNQPFDTSILIERVGARKISYLSFVINQKIDPQDPLNFRLFNIGIHILNSFLLYGIAIITVRRYYKVSNGDYVFPVALISTALFALHPLNINAVSYIIQRMASLAAFFVLLSLIIYVSAVRAKSTMGKVLLYTLTLFFILIGILAKENAIIGIPLILLYDYFFLSRENEKGFWRRFSVVLLLGCSVFLISLLFLPLHKLTSSVLKTFLNFNAPLTHKPWMATDVYWSPLEHILTEFRVISRYLFLFVLPLPRFLIFDWWGYPVSKGLFEPPTTVFSFGFISFLAVFSILTKKRFPFLAFGILWYLIAISLESFLAVGADLYFEHRNYLPIMGLSFGMVTEVLSLSKIRAYLKGYRLFVVFIILSSILGFLTFQRNFVWKTPATLWGDTVEKAPKNIRANLALAHSYMGISDFKNAERYYRSSLKVARDKKRTTFLINGLYYLGFMYLLLEKETEAQKVIRAFERLFPYHYKLNILKGYYRYVNHNFVQAIKIYQKILGNEKDMKRNDRVTLYTLLGDVYRDIGSVDRSEKSYKKALALNHSYPAAYHGLSKVHMKSGNEDIALEYLDMVIKMDPYNFRALSDKAYLLLITGKDAEEALSYAKRAVSLNPPFYQPYLIMGTILAVLDKENDSELFYEKARQHHAPEYLLLFNKAWASSLRGESIKQRYYLTELLKKSDTPQHMKETAKKILSNLAGTLP